MAPEAQAAAPLVEHRTITLTVRFGRDEVEAEVVGALAIHRSVGVFDDSWTLTHVPTGCAIMMSFNRARLDVLRTRLQQLDWSFTTPDAMPSRTRNEGVKIAKAWMKK